MNFNERLIELVRARPCLYAASHADFKNRQKKFSAWQEISCATGQTGKCLLLLCSVSIFLCVQNTFVQYAKA